MPKRCSICADPNRNEWVARRHMEGHSASKMEAMSRDMGSPIKRETIGRHLKSCVGVPKASPKEVKAVAEKVAKAIAPVQEGEDVAVLVQREVVAKLRDGQARVTVQHGLQAQQLLDRRAERAKDRELAVTLARLLHSPAPPSTAITARPVEVIEGQATEVNN